MSTGDLLMLFGIFLRILALVTVTTRCRRFYRLTTMSSGVYLLAQPLLGSVFWLAVWTGFLAIDGTLWWRHRKHDDDDETRGRRLLRWAKSKLPKPVIVPIRAIEGGQG